MMAEVKKQGSAHKVEDVACLENFRLWVAFIMGLVVMVIVLALFERIVKNNENTYAWGGTSSSAVQAVAATTEAYLGVEVQDLTADKAKSLNLPQSEGVLITRVVPNSPAGKAGLLANDLIGYFQRQKVETVDELTKMIADEQPDTRVRIDISRDGRWMAVYALLEERQKGSTGIALAAGNDEATLGEDWGITVSPLPDSLKEKLSIPSKVNGVFVVSVVPGSPATVAGVKPGDIIRSINHQKTEDMISFIKLWEENKDSGAVLDIYRDGTFLYIALGNSKMPAPPIPPGVRQQGGE